MKIITTLAVTAALIAGVSIAAAQTSSTTTPSQTGSMASGKTAAVGKGKFCIETSAGSASLQCKYASMAACEKDAKANNRQCSQNPNLGTTGSQQ